MVNWIEQIEESHPTAGSVIGLKINGVLLSGRTMVVLEYDPVPWTELMNDPYINRDKIKKLVNDPKATGLIRILR